MMTISPDASSTTDYRPIPPEPWGKRLARVREDVAGLTLQEAAAIAGHFMLTSHATIGRLEQLHEVPSGPRQGSRRQLAYVLVKAYEVDPAEFDLDDDDVPPGITIPPRSIDRTSTIW